MNNQPTVKEFWDEQATTHKQSDLATAPDTHYRQLEIASILRYLKDGARILDVGCGNGYSTLRFAEALPTATFVGLDYSEPMIEYAKDSLAKSAFSDRVSFAVGDVLALPDLGKFDYIVSERCLINLSGWVDQVLALFQMKNQLAPEGQIVLCENTQEGLARLNGLRTTQGLPEIAVRWHNYYMPEATFLEFARTHFSFISKENIGNLYYILSRVVYAKLAQQEGKEPEYLNPINEIAATLPTLGDYGYSPNFIFVLQNKIAYEGMGDVFKD